MQLKLQVLTTEKGGEREKVLRSQGQIFIVIVSGINVCRMIYRCTEKALWTLCPQCSSLPKN